MLKRIALLLMCCVLLCGHAYGDGEPAAVIVSAPGEAQAKPQTGFARVKEDEVNFRDAPGGKMITRLQKGEGVYVLDQADGEDGHTWFHVKAMYGARNRKGWIRDDMLEQPDTLFCDLVDVSLDESHVIALRSDGTVIAAGTGHCDCTDVRGLPKARDVVAGFYTSFVFLENGDYWGRGLAFPDHHDIGFPGLAYATTLSNTWIGIHEDGTFMHSQWLHEGYDDDGNQVIIYDASDLTNIVQLVGGFNLMACLTGDGRVHLYGYHNELRPEVEAWEGIQKISAFEHVVGLRADGTVVAAGANHSGECDVSGWTDIVDIAASEHYTLGLRADGTVVATGSNAYGACEVDGFTDIVQIEASRFCSVGRTKQGTLMYAGDFRFLDKTDAQGYVYLSTDE